MTLYAGAIITNTSTKRSIARQENKKTRQITECEHWTLGILDRGTGKLRLDTVVGRKNNNQEACMGFVTENVAPGSVLVTDGSKNYNTRALNLLGCGHISTNHSKKEWVKEGVTNISGTRIGPQAIERVWKGLDTWLAKFSVRNAKLNEVRHVHAHR